MLPSSFACTDLRKKETKKIRDWATSSNQIPKPNQMSYSSNWFGLDLDYLALIRYNSRWTSDFIRKNDKGKTLIRLTMYTWWHHKPTCQLPCHNLHSSHTWNELTPQVPDSLVCHTVLGETNMLYIYPHFFTYTFTIMMGNWPAL